MVNVLDPGKHKEKVTQASMKPVENQILLPLEALADTVEVEGMTKDTDYTVFYTDDNCAIEFLTDTTSAQKVSYDAVDPSMVTKNDIIGGYSATTHRTTGLELIDDVFPKYTLAPDIIVCPNWSHDNEATAVMSAKAENINGVFEAEALTPCCHTMLRKNCYDHLIIIPECESCGNLILRALGAADLSGCALRRG